MLFIDGYTCTGKIHQYTLGPSVDEIRCDQGEYFPSNIPSWSAHTEYNWMKSDVEDVKGEMSPLCTACTGVVGRMGNAYAKGLA